MGDPAVFVNAKKNKGLQFKRDRLLFCVSIYTVHNSVVNSSFGMAAWLLEN